MKWIRRIFSPSFRVWCRENRTLLLVGIVLFHIVFVGCEEDTDFASSTRLDNVIKANRIGEYLLLYTIRSGGEFPEKLDIIEEVASDSHELEQIKRLLEWVDPNTGLSSKWEYAVYSDPISGELPSATIIARVDGDVILKRVVKAEDVSVLHGD